MHLKTTELFIHLLFKPDVPFLLRKQKATKANAFIASSAFVALYFFTLNHNPNFMSGVYLR